MYQSNWQGHTLQTALNEQPSLSLDFYSYGVMLRKREGEMLTEFAVDPAQVAVALAAKVTFDTGLLSGNTVLVRQEGVKKTVVEYRKAQKTGIFLDGSETALRVPLPPLVMIRTTTEDRSPNYAVYAIKRKPASMDVALFNAPLPNLFNSGGICWGSVQRVTDMALSGASLAQDWAMLLGSSFGDHAVHNKSRSHPQDIRQKLIALEQNGTRRYPTSDLVAANKTLTQVLGGKL
ncbi:MAG: hypothetical protein RLP44_29870 [Aggregatilineales bacterium]